VTLLGDVVDSQHAIDYYCTTRRHTQSSPPQLRRRCDGDFTTRQHEQRRRPSQETYLGGEQASAQDKAKGGVIVAMRGGRKRETKVKALGLTMGVHLGRLHLGMQELKACGDGEEEQAFDEWEIADPDQHSDQRVECPVCGEEGHIELTPRTTSVLHRR
jgi:hypothetical protein